MTENNQSHSPLNHKLAAGLSAGICLVMNSLVYSRFFIGEDNHPYPNVLDGLEETVILQVFIMDLIADVLMYFASFEFCFWAFRQKWKKRKRNLVALFGTIGVTLLMSHLVFPTLLHLLPLQPDVYAIVQNFAHVHMVHTGFRASFVVFLSTLFISYFVRSQQARVENQRLLAENIRNRYETLKNQLDPHFLFNSLNTLDGLIGVDDEKARQYLQNLSSTFRYAIQNKDITTLKDELIFAEGYAYLMKIRYGDNLIIRYDVDEKYHHYHIMPISLQLLIENAVKHNVINDRYPLAIDIETTDRNTIRVSNEIQPKLNAEKGEGIGLANLVERYQLLFGMDVVITQNIGFAVEIPLIKEYESRHH